VRVELGCGTRKIPGTVGLDIVTLPGVDLVADMERGLPFRDGSVDELHAYHVLEHVDDFLGVMGEIWRVLRDGGRAHLKVPHAASSFMTWKDPTHRRALSIATFAYFDDTYFDGAAFSYYSPARFRIERAKLRFSAKGTPAPLPPPEPGRKMPLPEPHAIRVARRFVNPIFDVLANRSRQAQYNCERFWGPIVGIEEVDLVLRAIKR
jgi:SAM-dependent methyltransferase